jgi:hypothetical protein
MFILKLKRREKFWWLDKDSIEKNASKRKGFNGK